MAISLQKGANVNLTKSAPGLTKALLGLGWDARSTDGAAFDLDASALLLGANGKVRSDADFVFYGNKATADGSVSHGGDNLTGEGEGDDETILVDLSKVPADVERIALVVSIYEANERSQTFGQVRNAFIRLANADTNTEEVRYDLSEDYSTETAVIFAEVYRNNGEWKFKAIGQGFGDGLAGVARDFGVSV
jgi:tellurium resistance protein TerD